MARQGTGRRIVDGVPLVVVLWTWVLPATVLWRLAATRDLVVPFVPWFVWVVPGRLWAFSPFLWCIGLALATLAAYLVSQEALPRRKRVVGALWVLTVSVGAVHLLWGSAVIRAARVALLAACLAMTSAALAAESASPSGWSALGPWAADAGMQNGLLWSRKGRPSMPRRREAAFSRFSSTTEMANCD